MNKLKEIWSKTDDVFSRYPMVITMSLIAAFSSIAFAEFTRFYYQNEAEFFAITKLIIVACLGISLMFAIKMISQRIGKGFFLELLGTLFLVGFYFLLPKNEKDFTEVYTFLLIPTFILSHLLVSFGAFCGKEKEQNFWQFNKNLFINIFLTGVFTGVLTGGILLAILAVDKLFDLDIKDLRYQQTFFFLSIFGSTFIFLLFNEKGLKFLEKDGSYPQILKFFTQFVLIPLLLIYVVILYLYSVKILINWELPRGWVSYLVLAYSVVGILALLLVHPLKENSTKSWVKIFSKIFYFALIPLLVLLFVAIFTRILEYGFTEPRYFVLLLALWLVSVVFYFIFKKNASIKFIPISLFAFGLFALVFPYFNTFSVAKRSQKKDLNKILVENKLLKNGKIDFDKKINFSVADELASKAEFLYERKEFDFMNEYLDQKKKKTMDSIAENSSMYFARTQFRSYFKNIENDKLLPDSDYNSTYVKLISKNKIHNIVGYQYFANIDTYDSTSFAIDGKTMTIDFSNFYNNQKPEIIISLGSQKINLYPELVALFIKYPNQGDYFQDEIVLSKTLDNYELKIYFENIEKQITNDKQVRINFGGKNIFVAIKKLD